MPSTEFDNISLHITISIFSQTLLSSLTYVRFMIRLVMKFMRWYSLMYFQ